MADTLKLFAKDNFLCISTDKNEWAELTLMDKEAIYLGAETLPVIAGWLLTYLQTGSVPGRVSQSKIDGYVVTCLLTLSEAHYTLYAAEASGDRLLFWQNASHPALPIVATMRLSPAQCIQWQETLAAALEPIYKPALVGR